MGTSAAPRGTASASAAAAANAAAGPATGRRITGIGSELDLRGLVRALLGLEVRLLVEARAEEGCDEDGGDAHARGVEGLGLLVEAHALDRDPVLGGLELRLEAQEVLVGLQLGVLLHDHHQAGEGR